MASLRIIHAKIPKGLAEALEERVRLGVFRDTSEGVQVALRKAFAKEARSLLRSLSKAVGLKKRDLLAAWTRVRG